MIKRSQEVIPAIIIVLIIIVIVGMFTVQFKQTLDADATATIQANESATAQIIAITETASIRGTQGAETAIAQTLTAAATQTQQQSVINTQVALTLTQFEVGLTQTAQIGLETRATALTPTLTLSPSVTLTLSPTLTPEPPTATPTLTLTPTPTPTLTPEPPTLTLTPSVTLTPTDEPIMMQITHTFETQVANKVEIRLADNNSVWIDKNIIEAAIPHEAAQRQCEGQGERLPTRAELTALVAAQNTLAEWEWTADAYENNPAYVYIARNGTNSEQIIDVKSVGRGEIIVPGDVVGFRCVYVPS